VEREDFKEVVRKAWETRNSETSAIETWQLKVRTFRRLVKRWAGNVIVEINRHKQVVSVECNWLDLESKNRGLEDGEKLRMKQLARELESICALEEIKARQ
jgi:hypothetical protein